MVDTTIPGIASEIVEPDVPRPLGSAGRIAIVGIFEKADHNTPYFFNNPRDALRAMGNDPDYSGSKIIEYVFKQDIENNNYGASSIICVQAGTRAKAVLQLLDGSSANVLLLTAKSGGVWANGATGGLTVTVAAGTITGKKLVLKLNGTIVETYDNCTNTELMNKINATSSYITATGSSTELARTLASVTDSNMTSGSETSDPSTSDLNSALASILEENFDQIIFTDLPDDAYYPTIETWLGAKLAADKPCISVLPVDSSKNVSQCLTLMATADNQLINYINQKFTIGNDELNEAESAARYAGFIGGLPVNESPTNKIINDIDAISTEFSSDDTYVLTDKGMTVFELKNRENNRYGVVSAVTASQAVDDTGMKTNAAELYAIRSLVFVLNYMNLETWLGKVGISKTLSALEGELNHRKEIILKEGIVEELDFSTSIDSEEDKLAYVDISIKPHGIIKKIVKRIKLNL